MAHTRKHTIEVKNNGHTIPLSEVRWLVEQAVQMPASTPVRVGRHTSGDMREPDESSLTVEIDVPR
jgi:hypothetical protein